MTQVVIDAQSPSIATRPVVVPKGAYEAVVDQCLCRLLDRTPSERSEDKLVFLISVRLLPSGMGIDDESDQVT